MAASTRKDIPATDFNPFRDLTVTLEQFKVPGMDMSSFVDARRKDVAALVAANQVACEALQALARAQTDMLTQAMQGMQESAKGMLAGGGSADGATYTEAARSAWQKMLADMNALAGMARKAQAEAMAGLTARATENMKSMQDLAHVK